MCRYQVNSQIASYAARHLVVAVLAILLTACVAPIPVKDLAPKVPYSVTGKVALAVIDSRPILKAENKPTTFIGRAHSVFGIPVDMQVYPWVALKEEKKFSLAQELEERIDESLRANGTNVVRVAAGERADLASAKHAAQGLDADRILLINIDDWFVSINLNWVGSFNFDWGYTVDISDRAGTQLAQFKDSGRDVIDEKASDSPRNMITAAYRARLERLMERPDVHSALSASTKEAQR